MNRPLRQSISFAWLVVGLLWMVGMLNYLDRLTITTMRDSVKLDIPMTDAQFGLLTSVFLWVYAALSPVAGYMADRFSRTRVIVGSLLVWSLVTWLTGQCHTVGQLLVVRACMGIAEACYIPAALALIADYHRGPTRSLATGIHMSGIYAGSALGGIGGYLAESIGWRGSFSLFGLFGIGYAVVLALVLRDPSKPDSLELRADAKSLPPEERVTAIAAFRALLREPSYYALAAYWSLLSIAGWGISGWLPTYIREHFHMSQGAAGLSATAYIQGAAFIGILVGGIVADAWSRRNARGRLFVPVIGFLFAGPALFMSASTDVFALAVCGLILYGVSRGFADCNMMPILCQVIDGRYRATGYGVMNCFSCLTGGVMIYMGGALKDRNVDLGTIFQFAAGALVLAAFVLLLARPRRETAE